MVFCYVLSLKNLQEMVFHKLIKEINIQTKQSGKCAPPIINIMDLYPTSFPSDS